MWVTFMSFGYKGHTIHVKITGNHEEVYAQWHLPDSRGFLKIPAKSVHSAKCLITKRINEGK